MRRTDREITDTQKIKDIILACDCCRLGFADGDGVYIVPLNFGYVEDGDQKTFYFHSALEGRKLDLVRKKGYAGFELDTDHKINAHETACGYSFRFQSVIGEGIVGMVEDPEEKKTALNAIMAHYSGKADWAFTKQQIQSVSVFKLTVKSMSCKTHA